MTATIYKFPDLMPKKKNTIQALADEIIQEIIVSPTTKALDEKLMSIHNGRSFNYEIMYDDGEIEIRVNLKYQKED